MYVPGVWQLIIQTSNCKKNCYTLFVACQKGYEFEIHLQSHLASI